MSEVEMTLERTLSIWWSFMWRTVLVSMVLGFVLGFIGGILVGRSRIAPGDAGFLTASTWTSAAMVRPTAAAKPRACCFGRRPG